MGKMPHGKRMEVQRRWPGTSVEGLARNAGCHPSTIYRDLAAERRATMEAIAARFRAEGNEEQARLWEAQASKRKRR